MRVAARIACGDHESGRVIASIRAQMGRVGIILNALGSDPDRYRESRMPILSES